MSTISLENYICDNCDQVPSDKQCIDCKKTYCNECSHLHVKVKMYRDHNLEDIPKDKILPFCSNCDAERAKFICLDCQSSENLFCLSCSIFHPKIKLFRGHNLKTLEEFNVTKGSISDAIQIKNQKISNLNDVYEISMRYINYAGRVVSSGNIDDPKFWQVLSVLLVFSSLYYILLKLLLGDLAIVFNLFLVLILIIRIYSPKNPDKSVPVSIPKDSSIDIDSYREMFKGEFWHEKDPGPIKLRQRTRPYNHSKK